MVFLKLLGYAFGSVLIYWGIALFCVASWFLANLLLLLAHQTWNKITGRQDTWQGFFDWLKALGRWSQYLPWPWMSWIPGFLTQLWYAGYAADLVRSSTWGSSSAYAIAVHLTGVASVVLTIAVFYGLYLKIMQTKLKLWLYAPVGGATLVGYGVLLHHPWLAAVLSASWQRACAAVLTGLLRS